MTTATPEIIPPEPGDALAAAPEPAVVSTPPPPPPPAFEPPASKVGGEPSPQASELPAARPASSGADPLDMDQYATSCEATAGWLSRIVFYYVGEVLAVGKRATVEKGGMDHSDLWRMMSQDETVSVLEEHRAAWKEQEQFEIAKRNKAHAKAHAKSGASGPPPPEPSGPVKVSFVSVLYRQVNNTSGWHTAERVQRC